MPKGHFEGFDWTNMLAELSCFVCFLKGIYLVSMNGWGGAMSKEAVFTIKLEPELRAEFMAEAKAAHRPASQVLRELMRDYVQRQQEAREYEVYLGRKIEAGRASMRAGVGRSNDEIEAEFALRRASVAHNG